MPKFASDTKDWIKRTQDALDSNPDASGFLRRSLQRYIDDFHLMAVGLRPGPAKAYTENLYSDSLAAYDGPIALCGDLGVKW